MKNAKTVQDLDFSAVTASSPHADLVAVCAAVRAAEAALWPPGEVVVGYTYVHRPEMSGGTWHRYSSTFRACEYGTYAVAKEHAERRANELRLRGEMDVGVSEHPTAPATSRYCGRLPR